MLLVLTLLCVLIVFVTPNGDTFGTCDRSCRYKFGFFDREITGNRVGALGNEDRWGRYCKCYQNGKPIDAEKIDRLIYNKEWARDTWNGHDNYTTAVRCVLRKGESVTIDSMKDKLDSDVVLHCGRCSACSDLHDMQVIYDTKDRITENMTVCSTKYASPFSKHHGDLEELERCLQDVGINFTTDGRAWPSAEDRKKKPTCMDCWTDNIRNDAVYCRSNPSCIKKFFDPSNSGAFQGCLKCDEENSGAEFIRCAGSNRRSSGIRSDIDRHAYEICSDGYYYNKQVGGVN